MGGLEDLSFLDFFICFCTSGDSSLSKSNWKIFVSDWKISVFHLFLYIICSPIGLEDCLVGLEDFFAIIFLCLGDSIHSRNELGDLPVGSEYVVFY